ncbi:hypothetical protein LGM43_14880 [Burkholderia seminalis]|uniref:hypothetical protein n=1 Tax=Burkholderia seminalis TaxID=488731 RepID=UPI001CF3DECD|nr:hypothetical protein [Burkholderia seminalis]MCA7951550.1 hypothetical protein [Burkholderia seminalis]MDN7587914.1 hypothetical protein [Burkholderia seminalis]
MAWLAGVTVLSACGGGDSPITSVTPAQYPQNADMWAGLGGNAAAPAAIARVVDDAVAGLLADPKEAPYFANIGKPGHDSVNRLKACLNLQFKALFGGPFSYPGAVSADGQMQTCEDMATAHGDIGIPSCVFDQFIADAAAVMKADGVPEAYISRVAPVLVSTQSQIVSAQPQYLGPNTAENCK